METSEKAPTGGPNDWPMPDHEAFVALITVQSLLRQRDEGMGRVSAVHEASRLVGLERGPQHWLVDHVLASCFGDFYMSGDCYVGAETFLEFSTRRDRDRLGPELVEWAEDVAEMTPPIRRLCLLK